MIKNERRLIVLIICMLTALIFCLLLDVQYQKNTYKEISSQITHLQEQSKARQKIIDKQYKVLNEQQILLIKMNKEIEQQKQDIENLKTAPVFHASAYTANDAGCNSTTATGTVVKEGRTIAVDPKIIPLGSKVSVTSDFPGVSGIYVAEDTGGNIRGNRMDIYMESTSRAMEFGRRGVRVQVIERGGVRE